MHLALLPGMDGGAELLRPFCAYFPRWSSDIVAYPAHVPLDYAALEKLARARIAGTAPTVLIAESFSGPIAIRIAADPPANLRALVLVATFASAPLPRVLRHFALPALFALPPPRALVRRAFLGDGAHEGVLDAMLASIRETSPRVLSARLRSIFSVDVRRELARIAIPMMYLEGARDRLIRSERSLREARPDLRVERVDAPHLVLQCAPAVSAEIIVQFLSEHGLA